VGKEIEARVSEELWHLGIGDLLMPSVKPAPTAVAGPFVLTLRTSSTPIGGISNALQRFKHLHVYQLERRHEGRPQFVLRLGIIETGLEADAILATLREDYPGAFKASAGDEDREVVLAKARAATAKPAAPKSTLKRPVAPPTRRKSPPPAAVKAEPQPPFRWNIDEVLPQLGAERKSKARRPSPNRVLVQPRRAVTVAPTARVTSAAPTAPTAPAAPVTPAATAAPTAPTAPAAPAAPVTPAPVTSAPPAPTPSAPTPPNPALCTRPSPAVMPSVPAPPVSPQLALEQALEQPTAPAAEKPAARWADKESHWDPNAVTDQVESPVFTFDAPEFEADALQPPEVRPPVAQAPAVETVLEVNAVEPMSDRDLAPAEPASANTEVPESLAPAAAAPPIVPVEAVDPEVPTDAPQIDSTQTVRVLTALDLEDGQSSRGFAIQLMLSEEAIDPHEVPSLSIFAEYRLYAVTGLDGDRPMHALRLGFFSSETAAAAVAGYLATFFEAPCIKRVSVAEHERFEERRVTAGKDVGAGDGHVAIELSGPAPPLARQTGDSLPAPAKHDSPKASSIWSRLLPTRKS
jgi:hypothetical protein